MAPLSVLPGRVRFESQLIIGKVMDCRYLNEGISSISGVLDSSVNHRTGRILIRFNESIIDKEALIQRIKEIMKFMPHKIDAPEFVSYHREWHSRDIAKHVLPQTLIDVVAHAVLPKPLNLLLPVAINAMRR